MKTKHFIGSLAILLSLGLLSACSQDDAASVTTDGSDNTGLQDSTPTGKVIGSGFQILFEEEDIEVVDADGNFTQKEIDIHVYADDAFDLVDGLNGQSVKFKTEWGSFLEGRDSCVLEDGHCSVKWRSGSSDTIPGSCLVAFTAWTVGEEYFIDEDGSGYLDPQEPYSDVNLNGVFDDSEPFTDVNGNGVYDFEESYTDSNENGQYDPPELFTDANLNGVYDSGEAFVDSNSNGVYDSGETFVDANFNGIYDPEEPFVDTNGDNKFNRNYVDLNGNGKWDDYEVFADFEEPYLDIDSNGVYTADIASLEGEVELIDIVNFNGDTPGRKNNLHDMGNGKYDGSFCANGNSQCSGRVSVMVHARADLPIQKPFADSDDIDGDGDTTEEIRYCGPNPY